MYVCWVNFVWCVVFVGFDLIDWWNGEGINEVVELDVIIIWIEECIVGFK